jgi:mycoredoxin
MGEIKVYTTGWSGDCDRAKQFLDDEGIFYEEIDIEQSPDAARFVEQANGGRRIVPTFDIDGTVFSLKPFSWKKLQTELERLGVEDENDEE